MGPTNKIPIIDMLYTVPYCVHNYILQNLAIFFLKWTCAILRVLVFFLSEVNFIFRFMLALNYSLLWFPPITRPIYIIGSFYFSSFHMRRDRLWVIQNSFCTYNKLIRSFPLPLSLPYLYALDSASIYPASGQI